MSTTTEIQWCDATWNPVRGCARVSPGCEHCYAERQAHRFSGKGQPYEGLTVLGKHGPRWSGRARFVPEMLGAPLKWRKPQRIFVNSMSDLFHEDVTNKQIAAVFGVMAACPQHTFQVLTKRTERMREWLGWVDEAAAPPRVIIQRFAYQSVTTDTRRDAALMVHENDLCSEAWPLQNVWLGVSCEDQQRANERIPLLLECPAAVTFVSAEPLLGPVDLDVDGHLSGVFDPGPQHHPACDGRCLSCPVDAREQRRPLDWVIVGSESGPGARPMQLDWARSIVEQCKTAGVAVFVKQIANEHDRKGGDPNHWPEGDWPREFPR